VFGDGALLFFASAFLCAGAAVCCFDAAFVEGFFDAVEPLAAPDLLDDFGAAAPLLRGFSLA
jgi:hypothetical protein